MKRKKLIVRAVSLFMVGLITTLALVIPTSAIMAEYPTQDNVTYADCVMPFNVNFVGTNGSLDYVYSVPVGYNSPVVQTGISGHNTLTSNLVGDDGTPINTVSLEYYYYPTEWRLSDNDGWGAVPVELRIDHSELNGKTIVIEAPTFYVNPLASNWYNVSNPDSYNRWTMGAFRMPTLSDATTQAYVGRYTVSANIVDDVGTKHPVSYSKIIDTRIDNNWVSMLEPSIFQEYVINDIQETGYNRIVAVTDFKAYVDCDYYELKTLEPTSLDVWVTFQNGTLTRQESFSITDYVGQTFGAWLYDNNDLGDYLYSDSTANGIELTYVYGDDEYKGFITDGTNNVTSQTVIQEGVTYTCYCVYDDPIEGTWVFNNTINLPAERLFLIYSNESSSRVCGELIFNNNATTYLYCTTESTSTGRWFGFQISSGDTFYSSSSGQLIADTLDLVGKKLVIYDGWLYDEAGLDWLKANATKQSSASTVSVAEEPTSVSTDEWVKVENSSFKATGIDVSYPVYERNNFEGDLALNFGYPDFSRYISKFRGVGNIDINADFTGWIATATSGFLNFELLPGFSIGGVLAILVGFSLVILFLKIFAGG